MRPFAKKLPSHTPFFNLAIFANLAQLGSLTIFAKSNFVKKLENQPCKTIDHKSPGFKEQTQGFQNNKVAIKDEDCSGQMEIESTNVNVTLASRPLHFLPGPANAHIWEFWIDC